MDTKEVLKKNESLENFIRQYTDLISEKIESKPSIDRLENLRLFIAYLFLERIYFNSKGVLNLLPLLKKDFKYKIPTFLILRTMLSDVLTFYYLIKQLKCNNELEVKAYLSDNLRYHINYMKKNSSKEKFEEDCEFLKKRYEDLLINGELNKPDKSTPKQLSDYLKSFKGLEWISYVYEIYSDLSKFEHVGILTFDLQNTHLIDYLNYDFKNIILSIKYVYDSAIVILKYIDTSEQLDKRVKKLDKQINEI